MDISRKELRGKLLTAVRVAVAKLRFETKAGKTTEFPDWWPCVPPATGRGKVDPFPPVRTNCPHYLQGCSRVKAAGEMGHSERDVLQVAKVCT